MTKERAAGKHERTQSQKTIAVIALAIGLSACQNADGTPGYEAIPNMQNFTMPDDSTRCLNGGERPCAVQLRTEPKYRQDNIINALPNTHVEWPEEAYGNSKGDLVSIRCYTPNGDKITSSENNLVSTEWYEVEVPAEHWVNKAVKPNAFNADTYIGWASVTYFNQTQHAREVPKC